MPVNLPPQLSMPPNMNQMAHHPQQLSGQLSASANYEMNNAQFQGQNYGRISTSISPAGSVPHSQPGSARLGGMQTLPQVHSTGSSHQISPVNNFPPHISPPGMTQQMNMSPMNAPTFTPNPSSNMIQITAPSSFQINQHQQAMNMQQSMPPQQQNYGSSYYVSPSSQFPPQQQQMNPIPGQSGQMYHQMGQVSAQGLGQLGSMMSQQQAMMQQQQQQQQNYMNVQQGMHQGLQQGMQQGMMGQQQQQQMNQGHGQQQQQFPYNNYMGGMGPR
jgi:hypothetical protein